jgi:LacI family transcriptional regulator
MADHKNKSERVTLVDVARESGFSPSTVSIVLNDARLSQYVAAKTKEHIRKTALRLGYSPDIFARSLRSRRSHTVGVMIFDISDPFCVLLLRGIEKALHPTPFMPLIMDAHNDQKQFEGYLRMLMDRRVEGLIVVANWLFEEGGLLARERDKKLPTVVVGRDLSSEEICSVIVENELGGYKAMEHLHAMGHRRIAVIRGPATLSDSYGRWQGIQRFLTEHRLNLPPENVKELTPSIDPISGFDGGVALTEDLLRSGAEFTALLAFDDLTALGAVRALSQAGLRVPENCSVIGFDDIPTASISTPGLTTIRQPMEEMGAITAQCVLAKMAVQDDVTDTTPLLQMLPPSLVVRESTRSLVLPQV